MVDLPLRWPVEVNYHEAKAYCAWSGPDFRLLAEAEYHALRTPPVIPCCRRSRRWAVVVDVFVVVMGVDHRVDRGTCPTYFLK